MAADLLYKSGSTWVSLFYPVGSVYMSRVSTSPASIIGGSWTQIKGAVLAAYGANGYTLNNYGGSLKISVNQMPSHTHNYGNYFTQRYDWVSDGIKQIASGTGDTSSGLQATGGGQNFLPYHYGIYIWFRTA